MFCDDFTVMETKFCTIPYSNEPSARRRQWSVAIGRHADVGPTSGRPYNISLWRQYSMVGDALSGRRRTDSAYFILSYTQKHDMFCSLSYRRPTVGSAWVCNMLICAWLIAVDLYYGSPFLDYPLWYYLEIVMRLGVTLATVWT